MYLWEKQRMKYLSCIPYSLKTFCLTLNKSPQFSMHPVYFSSSVYLGYKILKSSLLLYIKKKKPKHQPPCNCALDHCCNTHGLIQTLNKVETKNSVHLRNQYIYCHFNSGSTSSWPLSILAQLLHL